LTSTSELIGTRPGQRVRFATCLTVGRHPSNALRLREQAVSSFHAVIEWVNDGWYVRDLGSRNGTTLNGRRLQQRSGLEVGDVLRFARTGAWRVEQLSVEPVEPALVEHARTSGLQRSIPDDLFLELRPDGPGEGIVSVRWGGFEHEQRLANGFLLLDFLAREPGLWISDAELRSLLWGRRGERMSRSALHTLIYNTRRVFEAWGLDGAIIEKDQGATRLVLQADQLMRDGGEGEES
jgi:hypothetical protein